MQFSHINIKKLFGLYDYDINFFGKQADNITILTGPNGYGKTTILTILNNLRPDSLYYFYKLKYDEIAIDFSDGSSIKIEQKITNEENTDRNSDTRLSTEKEVKFEWFKIDGTTSCTFKYDSSLLDKAKRNLSFNYRHRFYDDETKRFHNFEDYLLHSKELNEIIAKHLGQNLFIFQLETLNTSFIRANRIYNEAKEANAILPIEKIRMNIKNILTNSLNNYLKQSQKIDNRFINEIITQNKEHIPQSKYEALVSEVKIKKDHLYKFRLSDNVEFPEYNDTNSNILYAYVSGLKEKFEIYGNLSEKLILFENLLRKKAFTNKDITFSPQHGFQIISSNGEILDVNLLSSGEQNEIVLLYQMIFEVTDNSTLLIDEPENSLHVVWQQLFVEDMKTISKTKNLQVIISTHSFSIASKGKQNTIDLYYLINQ